MRTSTPDIHRAERTAQRAATSPVVVFLARLGYIVKGILYVVIGILAALLAVGHGGSATDQRGALGAIGALPFGRFILIVMTVGLFGFGLWSIIQGVLDVEGQGTKIKGILARVGYAAVGVAYIVLGYGTLRVVSGTGSAGKSSTSSTQDWTALLLKQPFGQALVVIVGLVVLAIALYLYIRAYKAQFQSHLNLGRLAEQHTQSYYQPGPPRLCCSWRRLHHHWHLLDGGGAPIQREKSRRPGWRIKRTGKTTLWPGAALHCGAWAYRLRPLLLRRSALSPYWSLVFSQS